MNIHFLREDALGTLKTNARGNLAKYERATNDWVYELCESDPFVEFKLPVGDIKLCTVAEVGSVAKADLENAIRLYTAMMDLSDTQAADERLWAGLTHGDLYSYMHERWQGVQARGKRPESSILERYFISERHARRGLFTNTVARLWWLGRLTYDRESKDSFRLTRYFETDFATKMRQLFAYNYMSNPVIMKGLIEALIELESSELAAGVALRDIYAPAAQFLNIYGGIHILDYYTSAELKRLVLDYMYPRLEQSAAGLLRTE